VPPFLYSLLNVKLVHLILHNLQIQICIRAEVFLVLPASKFWPAVAGIYQGIHVMAHFFSLRLYQTDAAPAPQLWSYRLNSNIYLFYRVKLRHSDLETRNEIYFGPDISFLF
jgi:hypothetical protein